MNPISKTIRIIKKEPELRSQSDEQLKSIFRKKISPSPNTVLDFEHVPQDMGSSSTDYTTVSSSGTGSDVVENTIKTHKWRVKAQKSTPVRNDTTDSDSDDDAPGLSTNDFFEFFEDIYMTFEQVFSAFTVEENAIEALAGNIDYTTKHLNASR